VCSEDCHRACHPAKLLRLCCEISAAGPNTHTPGLRLEFQTVHELNGCRGMCSIARCPLYVQCQSWAPHQHIQAACWVNNPEVTPTVAMLLSMEG
jgi:hypothetical protein